VKRERAIVNLQSKPHLPLYVRMHFDQVRQRTAVLSPERVYWPDETALDILKLCDGHRTISGVAAQLAETYSAPAGLIQNDVLEFVQSWTDLRLLRLSQT
jgi:pyrroloquinoline quinone biosynthesis protein D